MAIRRFQPGDETAQAAIFNAAAAGLPKFKAATVLEIQRRVRVRDFDPALRIYAEDGGQVVGYVVANPNGRVGYPWCLEGHERWREPLFDAALAELKSRGAPRAFAAYRADWAAIADFFVAHGFAVVREMINYFIEFQDMPTPSLVPTASITPVEKADLPTILELGAGVLRAATAAELELHLLKNPYFPPDATRVLRSRIDGKVLAAATLVIDPTYADARAIDPMAPCFRLGAFGTEGMTHKRVNGLFSILARPDRSLGGFGLELMGEAAGRVHDTDGLEGFAAQVPSDVPDLAVFYQRYFRKQGSFPIHERSL